MGLLALMAQSQQQRCLQMLKILVYINKAKLQLIVPSNDVLHQATTNIFLAGAAA